MNWLVRLRRRWPVVLYQTGLIIAAIASLARLWTHYRTWFWVVLAVGIVGYAIVVFVVAKYHVDGQPRRDMYICDVHGPMPPSMVVVLADLGTMEQEIQGRTVREPIKRCVLCFENACKVAKQNLEKNDGATK